MFRFAILLLSLSSTWLVLNTTIQAAESSGRYWSNHQQVPPAASQRYDQSGYGNGDYSQSGYQQAPSAPAPLRSQGYPDQRPYYQTDQQTINNNPYDPAQGYSTTDAYSNSYPSQDRSAYDRSTYPRPQWQIPESVPGVDSSRPVPMRDRRSDSAQIIIVPSTQIGSNIMLGGTVVPYKEVTLAAQIPGRVEFIAGDEGDWFDDNKVLLAINDDDLLAKRRQAMAELANAESVMRNTQVQYSRELWSPQSRDVNRMPGMGLPSMFDQFFTRNLGSTMGYGNPGLERYTDLYSSGTRVSQAQSRLLQARSALEEVDTRLRDARSVAPFSGVITKKLVEVGDTVQPGQPLLHYADTRYLQMQVEVPARLTPGLNLGMILPVKLDVGNAQVDARVAQIFPIADAHRHTVTVKLDLPIDTPGGPGMYAEVLIPDVNTAARSMPVIPYSAIVWRGSLPAVFVLNQENRTELRLIRIGEAMGNQTVSVLSGIRGGERIYLNPPPGMGSGWTRDSSGQGFGQGSGG